MNPNFTYLEILDQIDAFNPVEYEKSRNHLDGLVSRLSPYLTRGVISLPAVRTQILKKHTPEAAEKFLQELAWREYFQKVFASKQNDIFSDIRFKRDDWRHSDLVSAVVQGMTGIQAIDKQITLLYETGYMHNHARMWTAMLACNVAMADWKNMSRWMYYHLIDGDLASNTLSWQWVAGTSINKRYVANQSLINACSNTNQSDTYLDMEREQVGALKVPAVLMETEHFNYQTKYLKSSELLSVAGKTVFLYHPWSIDSRWRTEEVGERIFVIEPRWFDAFPVSEKVMTYILNLLSVHVPEAQVFVGNVETIPGIDDAEVFSKSHPATIHYSGTIDSPQELYPAVQGYYPSFYAFWKECQKT